MVVRSLSVLAFASAVLWSADGHARRERFESVGLDVEMPDDARSEVSERFVMVTLPDKGVLIYVHRIKPHTGAPADVLAQIAASMKSPVAAGYAKDGAFVHPIMMAISGQPFAGVLAYVDKGPDGAVMVQALTPKDSYTPTLDRLAILMAKAAVLIPIVAVTDINAAARAVGGGAPPPRVDEDAIKAKAIETVRGFYVQDQDKEIKRTFIAFATPTFAEAMLKEAKACESAATPKACADGVALCGGGKLLQSTATIIDKGRVRVELGVGAVKVRRRIVVDVAQMDPETWGVDGVKCQ